MYCVACGALNADNNRNCTGCGASLPSHASVAPDSAPNPVNVPNHMLGAVLATFCCCVPLGIGAVIYASQVNTKLAAGDIPGAQAASKNASTFIWLSVILGGVFGVLYAVGVVVTEGL